MERGYIRIQAPDGTYPYEEFQIDSSESVFLTLTAVTDGTAAALDVSSGTVVVKLRAKPVDSATVPIDLTMTKRTGNTNPGDTGKVSTTVTLRADDFTAGTYGLMGCYVVDTATADTLTPSGYKETLWRGLWEFYVRGAIDA